MCPGVSFGLNLSIAYPVRFTKTSALESQLLENPELHKSHLKFGIDNG